MVHFKLEDNMFFLQDAKGHLRQLPRNALEKDILSADEANLKLDNQKNGWKGVCVDQEQNGNEKFSLVGYWGGDEYQSGE